MPEGGSIRKDSAAAEVPRIGDITGHKREEENLRRFATVVRDSNDAITIQDFEGRITAWNRGAELMYGYSEAEALLANIERLTSPGKVAEQKDFTRRLVAGEKISSFETQRVTKDGRTLDVWLTVTKLMDAAGKPIGIASTERDITGRKREAEEASRMVTVVRDSNDAITIQDFEGQITAWNHGAEQMYGYGEAEALQMNIGRLTPADREAEQKDFTRRLVAGEAITSLETQRVTKDGRILDIWMTVTKLVDDAGNPIGIASTERDITARKREEENLRRFATVVRDSNDAITIQDFEGRITAWNRGAELMYGYGEAEALAANIERLTTPAKVAEQKDFIRRLIAGEAITSFETQRVTKDGRVLDVWMTVTKLMDEAGKPVGLASTERDITARKREEENLRRMATVVRDSNDAITISDFNGRITAWNRGAEQMYGYSETEALQMSLWLLTPPDKVPEKKAFINRLIAGEAISSFETQRVTKDGRILDVWLTLTKLTDDAGKPIGIASTERDITARKRAEEQLRLTLADLERSNKELEQFAYVASHDLQEPLRMISSYTQLLAQRYGSQLDEKARRYVNYTVDGVIRMQALINDLLAYSRAGTRGRPLAATDTHAVLGEAIRNLAAMIAESRAIITNDDLPTVRADATQLVLVFQNLLANAIKFRRDEPPRVHVSAQDRGPEWVFAVKDGGIGIEPQHAERVFVIFQRLHTRTEYPGTGIGLAVCKRIVERHGGKIWFESKPGHGTTFFFTLPK